MSAAVELTPLKTPLPPALSKQNGDRCELIHNDAPRVIDLIEHGDIVRAEYAKRKLRWFTEQAWHIIEPDVNEITTFKNNWHIDALCDHLQACFDGGIRNLLINVPPRHVKSITSSVMFPCWVWAKRPAARFLTSSYAQALSTRDSLKSRRILQSVWYRKNKQYWFEEEKQWELAGDQNVKQRYDNTETGYRIATSVGGIATGDGGDFVIVDDPHNVMDAESDVMRENTLLWWDEVMSTRLNDPSTGVKIIIMQRTHQSDLAGHVLDKGVYEHLMLPMEYDPARSKLTSIGFLDPRREEGELLHPNRIDRESADNLKRDLGSYATAGQLQQRPSPREGNLIKIDQLNFVDEIDETNIKKEWRSWDKAGTDGGGAYTVGALIGKYKTPRKHTHNCGHFKCKGSIYYVRDIVRGQWSSGKRETIIRSTADRDGKAVWIVVEQEPGSGGKESAENTKANLRDRHCDIDTVSGEGNKEKRADPFAVAVENGEYDVLIADWNDKYTDELGHFPHSTYKDQTDATAQGHNKIKKKSGLLLG